MSDAKPLTILDTQLVQSTLVACGTLLVYDFLCTLDQEISYAWSASWSFGTVLFFLNRYSPFVDTFLSLYLKFSVNTPERCLKQFTAVTWLIVSGLIISEVILMLRTYAIWERRRSVAIILCISSAVTFIPAIIITHIETKSFDYIASQVPGCHLASASDIIIVCYILLALSETTMAFLTGIKAYRHFQNSRSDWIAKLYREGLLFYVYLLFISLANVLVPILAPRIFGSWLATPQRVMHSVLCNRVLLLILKQKRSTNMVNRIPRMRNPSQDTPSSHQSHIFESYEDEELSANMTIMRPSTGTVLTENESSHDIP